MYHDTHNCGSFNHRDLSLVSLATPFQIMYKMIVILKVKDNNSRVRPLNSIISKKDSLNFLKQLLKVILVALFHFPKFQLGTKMGSRDIGKMVAEKVGFSVTILPISRDPILVPS